MRTFSIETLGCKVNQYETEQLAELLRSRGLVPADSPRDADLRIINTCSVTIQAAAKSRQTVRRSTSLPVLANSPSPGTPGEGWGEGSCRNSQSRTIVTGCWATSNRAEAEQLPGVDAVLNHHDDVAAELNRLLDCWMSNHRTSQPLGHDLLMIQVGTPAHHGTNSKLPGRQVKQNPAMGTHSLPLLGVHQTGRQRALLKIQDGCDAHCTYCIIPQLRPSLWSKPIEQAVTEAKQLVDSGHVEIVLTGIFLGAYGHPTALRRRQKPIENACAIADLVNALCTQVSGLRRLRFSSLEPADLTPQLISILKSHPQVVPHFHLPLQSGSREILRRMNRQYTPDDYLRMIDTVHAAFDRPAITTDIIVGFPGETDAEFDHTVQIADRVGFIHIHAFSFSPRPGTAAARWSSDFAPGSVVNDRIRQLTARAAEHSETFRRRFVGESVELLVEQPHSHDTFRHGRSERYFDVHFDDPIAKPGDAVKVTIDRVTPNRTFGQKAAWSLQ